METIALFIAHNYKSIPIYFFIKYNIPLLYYVEIRNPDITPNGHLKISLLPPFAT